MILRLCALALVAAMSFFLLSEFKWRGAPIFAVICFIGILAMAEPYITGIGDTLGLLAESSVITDTASSVLKVVGVCYLAGISADICNELGVPRVGNAVTLVGRLEIIAIAAPYFLGILEMGTELIR